MKIFLSSLSVEVLLALNKAAPDCKPNVLLTYYGLENPTNYTEKYRHMIGDLILDCGAFSLNNLNLTDEGFTREANLLFRKYRDYTELAQGVYDFLFSFDDKFEPDSFDHNLDRLRDLEAAGVKAAPVIHNLSNHEVDYFIEQGYRTVAIGQCRGADRKNLSVLGPVVDKLYYNSPKVKVHLFGMTAPRHISHVPAYSCDSKTWLDYGSRGRILYWNPEKRGLDKTDLLYFPKDQNFDDSGPGVYYHDYKYLSDFKKYIGALNLELTDLNGLEFDVNRQMVNAFYFLELENRITNDQLVEGINFE